MNINPNETNSSGQVIDLESDLEGLNVVKAQEDTRGRIAIIFTIAFLIIIIFCIFIPFISHWINPQTFPDPVESAKNLMTAAASVLSAPFGFIVGFYYKQNATG